MKLLFTKNVFSYKKAARWKLRDVCEMYCATLAMKCLTSELYLNTTVVSQ